MNKRIIALFISLIVVIVLIVVLAFTFTIGDVVVETPTKIQLSEDTINTIIADSEIVKHSSIFYLNEEIAIKNIEARHPSLKVLFIERKFPNIVSITVTRRVPIFSLQLEDGTFACIDNELKAVKIVDTVQDNYITPITGVNFRGIAAGTFIDKLEWLKPIISSAMDESFIEKRFPAFIDAIEYRENVAENVNLIILKTNTGISFVIDAKYSKNAFRDYYNAYMQLSDQEKGSGYLIRTQTDGGVTVIEYKDATYNI